MVQKDLTVIRCRYGSPRTEQPAVDRYGARQATVALNVGGLARLSMARPAMESLPAHSDEDMDDHTGSVPPACLNYVSVLRQIGRSYTTAGNLEWRVCPGGPKECIGLDNTKKTLKIRHLREGLYVTVIDPKTFPRQV